MAVTQRALFFAGEQDGHPEGEIQGVGPPGRGGLRRQQKQQGRRSGHLTKSSTMGEYEGSVGTTWGGLFLVLIPPGDLIPEQSPLKLSSGTEEVLVTPREDDLARQV